MLDFMNKKCRKLCTYSLENIYLRERYGEVMFVYLLKPEDIACKIIYRIINQQ